MLLSVREYADRVRGSVWERELVADLRNLPEAERLGFLQELAAASPVVALSLASKSLDSRESFESLLYQGLDDANSSSIRYWLECTVPRLGFRRVMVVLRSCASANPNRVRDAAYWLPSFEKVPGFSRSELATLGLN